VGQVRDVRQPLFLLQRHSARRPNQPDRGGALQHQLRRRNTPNNWRTDLVLPALGPIHHAAGFMGVAIRLAASTRRTRKRRVESILATVNTTQVINGVSVSVPGYQIPPVTRRHRCSRAPPPPSMATISRAAKSSMTTCSRSTPAQPATSCSSAPSWSINPEDTKTYSSGGTSTTTSNAIRSVNPQSRARYRQLQSAARELQSHHPELRQSVRARDGEHYENRVDREHRRLAQPLRKLETAETTSIRSRGSRTADSSHISRSGRLQKPRAIRPPREPFSNISLFYDNSKNFAYNGFGTTPAGVNGLLPPSQGEQKEVGAKSTWLDNRSRLTSPTSTRSNSTYRAGVPPDQSPHECRGRR